MATSGTLIDNVSDTALWVAYYRAKETNRPDALFKDPLAQVLMGDRGQEIAEDMKSSSRYTEWTVVMRTVIIDRYIQQLVQEGIDTVVNLGAGLDTRPYRLDLPETLRWIEADHPEIIAHKNKTLRPEVPRCQLARVGVDLTDGQKRKQFLAEAAAHSKNILVITEGVVIYLNEREVAELAEDLFSFPQFTYWIIEYLSPQVYPHLKSASRRKKMKNAPFQFFPDDWMGFFEQKGWIPRQVEYLGEEGLKAGRAMPMPKLAFIFKLLASKATQERSKRMTGFVLFQRKNPEM
jgi:methyltransferase (TIGR00027 family)